MPFQLTDDDCPNWEKSKWSTTTELHCNFYHADTESGSALILGDAAHAPGPDLGMGLNIALQDAQVLGELLTSENIDSLDKMLREFSKRRVKIGNAIVTLSSNLDSLEKFQFLIFGVKSISRSIFGKVFGWIDETSFRLLRKGAPIDEVYKRALKQGFQSVIDKNERIRSKFRDLEMDLLPKRNDSFAKVLKQEKKMGYTRPF